jgi:hypothetical protein
VAVQIAALENTRSLEQIQRISSRLSFVGESQNNPQVAWRRIFSPA